MKRKMKLFALVMIVGFVCGFFSSGWAEEAIHKININTATAEELTDLKGVGETIAQRIIAYREQNGPFATANDLLNVNGIGPKIFSDNESVITVGNENETSMKKTKGAALEKSTKAN